MVASQAFRLISKTKANDLINVMKFLSKRTGMQVTIADVEGPVVDGYFCVGRRMNACGDYLISLK